jgi:hypothetical protein
VRSVLAGHSFFSGGNSSPLLRGRGVEQSGCDQVVDPMETKSRARAKGTS